MLLGRHRELWARGARYVLCGAPEAHRLGGRVLPASQAVRVVQQLFADGSEHALRRAYGERSDRLDAARASGDEVLRWLRRELGDSSFHLARGRLALVAIPRFGWTQALPHASTSEAKRLVSELRAASNGADLPYEGHRFRVLLAAHALALPDRDRYEVVPASEAQRVLQAMAHDVRFPASLRALLDRALPSLAAADRDASTGALLLLRRPLEAARRVEEPAPPTRPPRAAPKRTSFIAVVVSSEDGQPLAGAELELAAPDGTIRQIVTDQTGLAALADIAPGTYRIALLGLDRSSWTADGATGALLRTRRDRTHVVKQGECLSQIAHAAGTHDWQKVWDHPHNAKLKAKRKSPHVLRPGDALFLPGMEIGQIERPTDAAHSITVARKARESELVITLRDHEGDALKDEPYELTFAYAGETQTKAGQLSGSGELRVKLPISVRSADLSLPALGIRRKLAVGHLDPAHDEGDQPVQTGVQARLLALGYASHKAAVGPHAELRAAVLAFQKLIMEQSDPTGELDAATCRKLEEEYGV